MIKRNEIWLSCTPKSLENITLAKTLELHLRKINFDYTTVADRLLKTFSCSCKCHPTRAINRCPGAHLPRVLPATILNFKISIKQKQNTNGLKTKDQQGRPHPFTMQKSCLWREWRQTQPWNQYVNVKYYKRNPVVALVLDFIQYSLSGTISVSGQYTN